MPNEEFTLTTAREALERCWSNGASGSHEVAPGRYVQWARWPEGVQVECSSDAFWQEGSCHSCSDASSRARVHGTRGGAAELLDARHREGRPGCCGSRADALRPRGAHACRGQSDT